MHPLVGALEATPMARTAATAIAAVTKTVETAGMVLDEEEEDAGVDEEAAGAVVETITIITTVEVVAVEDEAETTTTTATKIIGEGIKIIVARTIKKS